MTRIVFETDREDSDDYKRFWKDEKLLAKNYEGYNSKVVEFCREKSIDFIVFNMKEGWEPLCKFLDKPIPEIEFPREMDIFQTRTMLNLLKFGDVSCIIILSSLVLLMVFLVIQQFL